MECVGKLMLQKFQNPVLLLGSIYKVKLQIY